MKKFFIITIILFYYVCVGNVFSVPAYPKLISVKQSDDKMVNILLKGDEKVNWAKTTDNYTLLRSENGDYVYAISDNKEGIIPSKVVAHNEKERDQEELKFIATLSKDLFYSSEQISLMKQIWEIKSDFTKKKSKNDLKTTSEYRMIVILMQFPNLQLTYSRDFFDNLFNQVGYNLNGNEGSVKDYFNASTFGQLNVVSTVAGPFTASNNYEMYGQAQSGYSGAKVLLTEAVNAANPTVNFANYCNSGSNYVDCVYMIYAGYAQSGGTSNTIWPHRSVIYPEINLDGVYIYDYACSSEMSGSTWNPEPPTIGTICHEFSHVLGLADFYDTDYQNQGQSFDSGPWDLMASGNYNNNGKCPPLWSSFQRNLLNLCPINELVTTGADGKGNKTLTPLYIDNKAYKISFSTNEYFILENRQQIGWDRFLPGHGMLIYHVDKNVTGWNYNCANCDPTWMGFDIEEANNLKNEWNRAGHTFPGTSNKLVFNDASTPSSLSNLNVALGRPVERIKENLTTKNITFDFGGVSATSPIATTNSILIISSDTLLVSATITPNTDPIVEKGIIYSTNSNPISSDTKILDISSSNTYSLAITGQQPSSTIYVRAYVKSLLNAYYYGEIIRVDIPCQAVRSFPYTYSFEQNDINSNCWSQEAGQYISNTWKYVSTSGSGGITSAQDGNEFALLRTDSNNTLTRKLVSCPLDISVLSQPYLKYYYSIKQRGSSQEQLKIYYRVSKGDNWQLLKTNSNQTNNWQLDSILLPNKSKTYYIAFEAVANYGYGVCVDNITISEANLAAFPVVSTLSAENITDVSVKINASVQSQGYTTLVSKGICWSTNPMPTIYDSINSIHGSIGQYSLYANNLQPNTKYYIRAFASNQGLVSYGSQIEVMTKCARISVFPYLHNSESSDSNCVERGQGWNLVTQEGNINPYSGTNFYGFKSSQQGFISKLILPLINLNYQSFPKLKFWYNNPISTSIDTLKVYYRIGSDGAWNLLKTISTQASSWTNDSIDLINPQDNYYIAFEGISSNGLGIYLDDISYDAVLQLPLVNTTQTSLATYNSIQTGGNVTYSGLSTITERGVCYSKSGNSPTISDLKVVVPGTLGIFPATIPNLSPESTYKVRAYAKNSFGVNYGEQYSINTPPTPIFGNTISGNQELCYNSVTQVILGSTPTGGDGNFTYTWLQSFDSINWLLAEDADFRIKQSYLSYRAKVTSYFKRVVSSRLVSDTSNTVSIIVYPTTRGGNVFRPQDTTLLAQGVRMELRASQGKVINWERKKLNFDWQELSNTSDSIWLTDFPQSSGLYYYRAKVKSGVCALETSGEDWIYVKNGVGLEPINIDNETIIISPNPSNGAFNIIYNRENDFVGSLIIYDVNGKEIKTIDNLVLRNSDNRINVNPIEKGTYLLVFKSNKDIFSRIIIINK